MTSPGHTDFSTETIPDSWSEAAGHAPDGDGKALAKMARLTTPMAQGSVDLFTACLGTAAVSIVAGYGWYQLQKSGVVTPWIAVALGAVIALSVRLGGGRDDAQTRGMVSLLFYVATASTVFYLVARGNYLDLYGTTPSLKEIENELLHSRLTDPLAIVAWFGGAAASVWISKALR